MDWIKFGWGAKFESNFNPHDAAVLDLSAAIPNVECRLPLDIAIDTVKEIVEKYPPPYNLMVSGGVDSQAMLYAWYKSGVPFTAINFLYASPDGEYFNKEDTYYLKQFAQKFHIKIQYRTFDIIGFLESELDDYAMKYTCTSPQICAHMAMISTLTEGTTILSGNFIMLNNFPGNYTILGTHRYSKRSNQSVIPFFFLHSPKLAVAFDIFKELDTKNRILKVDSYIRKCQVFTAAGFPIIPQNFKMTGFERVKEYYDQFPHLINTRDRFEYASEPSKRVFDYIFRYKFRRSIHYNDTLLIRQTS